MQISARNITLSYQAAASFSSKDEAQKNIKDSLKNYGVNLSNEELDKLTAKGENDSFFAMSFEISITEISIQGNLNEIANNRGNIKEFLNNFKDLVNDNLDSNSAKNLLLDNAEFGSKNTAKRMAEQILKNANNDANKLRLGKDGLLSGFNEALKRFNFGDDYMSLANKTLDNAIKMIDEQIAKLGENLLNFKA
ncbi:MULTISPECIES: hypothetical protein [unclassified Campylobacter]|uniref:hypothetical protein n=1 Tax=unclassified Campylobacter TaxID=2593542 RepID=UPI001BDB0CBB|nr:MULTISPECIES: hypothetical protein [unclassified Campylobacter]MBZ7976415.1 hypothetical protein [Campylobacter sp. RM12637]MBZ7991235.1 hypothetical protein [Campylobacter sp. RM9331]MBZ7992833.1 hypothetical protein [Campylobacter sp. RM9333]MBZ8006382.1 hypothetical protein [Campylobacter sp. RM9332]MBZ8007594.1 hypothetical protein [Campylobacter sp. RM9334]